jgi:hypothetical protein
MAERIAIYPAAVWPMLLASKWLLPDRLGVELCRGAVVDSHQIGRLAEHMFSG